MNDKQKQAFREKIACADGLTPLPQSIVAIQGDMKKRAIKAGWIREYNGGYQTLTVKGYREC